MKETVTKLLTEAVASLAGQGLLEVGVGEEVSAERTRDSAHGDFASNVAMKLAKRARCNPRELAAKIIQAMPESELLEKTEIAGPGFINFTFRNKWSKVGNMNRTWQSVFQDTNSCHEIKTKKRQVSQVILA